MSARVGRKVPDLDAPANDRSGLQKPLLSDHFGKRILLRSRPDDAVYR